MNFKMAPYIKKNMVLKINERHGTKRLYRTVNYMK